MLVGVAGFEPTTFRSQSGRATKLRHTPSVRHVGYMPIGPVAATYSSGRPRCAEDGPDPLRCTSCHGRVREGPYEPVCSRSLRDRPRSPLARGRSSMVEPQSSKLATRVRFPSPAPFSVQRPDARTDRHRAVGVSGRTGSPSGRTGSHAGRGRPRPRTGRVRALPRPRGAFQSDTRGTRPRWQGAVGRVAHGPRGREETSSPCGPPARAVRRAEAPDTSCADRYAPPRPQTDRANHARVSARRRACTAAQAAPGRRHGAPADARGGTRAGPARTSG